MIIDLFSRRIVGWAFADHMRTELVTAALRQALGSRQVAPGLIFHSDRSSQYGSRSHREMLDSAEILQSMSARANPYHNAWTESFEAPSVSGSWQVAGSTRFQRPERTSPPETRRFYGEFQAKLQYPILSLNLFVISQNNVL